MCSLFKFFVISVCSGTVFIGGCQKEGIYRNKDTQPFAPVHVEFIGQDRDTLVEMAIEKRLFCRACLFLRAGTTPPSPYTLIFQYNRRIDLKSLGLFILTGALASFEAEFTYSLQVQVLEDDIVLNEYYYEQMINEMTDSAFRRMTNPFHKINGRSEGVFAELTDNFLCEVLIEKPLPQVESSR